MPPRLIPFDYAGVETTDWAYLAALIDGEGCICSSLPRSNARPLRLRITMIHHPTIRWLQLSFGGTCMAHKTKAPNARQSWTWQISGKRTALILRGVFAYLKAKKDEALVALELADTFDDVIKAGGKLKVKTLERRIKLGSHLRDLKRREWKA